MRTRAQAMFFAMLKNSVAAVSLEFQVVGLFPDITDTLLPYDEELSIVNGDVPYVIDEVTGLIPPGLALSIGPSGETLRLEGTVVIRTTPMFIEGKLPRAVSGTPYSERLQVVGGVDSVSPIITISRDTLPGWLSVTWHADTNEIEFHGTPP